jgi:hypothetical protein
MRSQIQVGSILIEDRAAKVEALGIESEPYVKNWSLLSFLNGRDLDRRVRATNWSFFFLAEAKRGRFFGDRSGSGMFKALTRILAKGRAQSFNCLEVTEILDKHFLGIHYTTIVAHCRHLQPRWRLDDLQLRQTQQQPVEASSV